MSTKPNNAQQESAGEGAQPTRPPILSHYTGLALLMIVAAGLVFWGLRTCQVMLNENIEGVRNTFGEVLRLHPEIRVNQLVVYGQVSPIEELAIVKNEQLVEITLNESMRLWSTPIPMTQKEITLRAIFRIKAGFDLSKPFVVNIDEGTGTITAQMPKAEILSVERVGPLSLKEEAGWLTRIQATEREQLLNRLQEAARAAAKSSGLTEEAEEEVVQRLESLAERNGQQLDIRLTPSTN